MSDAQIIQKRPVGRPPLRPTEFSGSTPVTRFTLMDLPEWGEWLMTRLSQEFGEKPPPVWKGKINGIASSNDFLFIKNADAVFLAEIAMHPLSGKIRVQEVFGWSKHSQMMGEAMGVRDRSEAERSLISLYRFARQYARDRGCRIRVGMCSDLANSSLKEGLNGEYLPWVSAK
jgi:hypothetical protein